MHYPYKFWRGRQVFDDLKAILIHVPKNGGGSIRLALSPDAPPNFYGGHTSFIEYRDKLPKHQFDYLKIAFTRNPYDRFVSAYKYLKRRINNDSPAFTPYITPDEVKDFPSFVNAAKKKLLTITHIRPQHLFICDENFKVGADFLGKFENFNADFQRLCQILSIHKQLPHLHKSYNAPPITDELQTIKQLYQKDYELFYPELL